MSEFNRLDKLLDYMEENRGVFGWKSQCEALIELAERLESEIDSKDKLLAEAQTKIDQGLGAIKIINEGRDTLRATVEILTARNNSLFDDCDELKQENIELQEQIERLKKTSIAAMDNAIELSSKQLEIAQRLRSESSPDALESERKANAMLADEIERLALLAQNQETVITAQRRSARAKDELIEQMREAISDVLRHAEPPQHDIRGCTRANCWWCQVIRVRDAALSAAERMSK